MVLPGRIRLAVALVGTLLIIGGLSFLAVRAQAQAVISEVCDRKDIAGVIFEDCLTASRFIRRDIDGKVLVNRAATAREQSAFVLKRKELERAQRLGNLPTAADLRARALAVEAGPGQSPLADVRALSQDLADALRLLAELRE